MATRDALSTYRSMRDFGKTPEPAGRVKKSAGHHYLIQKHAATRLHYDFRLELDGVLKSWAVTRGPSLDPHIRRLAVQVEDHPLDYGSFEGIIPKGQYGGGTVMLWDKGSWEPLEDPHTALKKGKLSFRLKGKRLKGEWSLVRLPKRPKDKHSNWLLIKKEDRYAKHDDADTLLKKNVTSVISNRTMEEIATAQDAVWQSKEAAPLELPVGKKAALPAFIKPQLATLSDKAPEGAQWVHEIKFDGYRIIARIANGKTTLLTRTGQDWTKKFNTLAKRLAKLPVTNALLDGEIVALREDGTSDFGLLQEALSTGRSQDLHLYLFDALHVNGQSLIKLPLLERKQALEAILRQVSDPLIHYSEHFTTQGDTFLAQACRLHLEGAVSKRSDAPYTPGRGTSWLKSKCNHRQEFVIGGFTLPTAGKRGIGALLLGIYRDGTLQYAGKVGTGFSHTQSLDLRKKLDALTQEKSAFAKVPVEAKRGAHWVKPELACEVEFTEWTRDNRLRHPSFQGLREDKPAKAITKETPLKVPLETYAGIKLTHPDRVIYPEQGITKHTLADYYMAMADHILPFVAGRLLSLVRCPDGMKKTCFFQRHTGFDSPYLHVVEVEGKEGRQPYLMIKDIKGIMTLVQWNMLELHLWGSRADKPDQPDWIIFDLDPDPTVPWERVVEAALEVRERLRALGLQSFLKTTGGKGLHVTAPIRRRYAWPEVKAFAKYFAETMAKENPKHYTSVMSKARRKGRIFIDYLRNEKAATAVSPFSSRARAGAPVAMTLDWKELTPALNPADFTIATVPNLVAKRKRDPWDNFFTLQQALPKTT